VYAYKWDQETGGILLTNDIEEGLMKQEVRPVFFEELDLLGFDRYWEYPRVEEPLLWALGARKYYYYGELVAETEGGGMFTSPQLKIYKKDLKLKPVNIQEMVNKNNNLLQGLIQKSLKFIYQTYKRYIKEVDIAAVAFSGGKDSLVLLDLVQRVLEPSQFVVVFSDTGMEVSDTYLAVEEAKNRWPHLSFYIAKSNKDVLTTWHEFGPPSRIHRWCCVVHKSAPTLILLRKITGKPAVRALIFDGVRHEESVGRMTYLSTAYGEKHQFQINARPILSWNSFEVFLYLFSRSLMLNKVYRFGATRVGCVVCPMASEWKEAIIGLAYKDDAKKFVNELHEYAIKAGVRSDKINSYLEKGSWKGRAGGRFLSSEGKKIFEEKEGENVIYNLLNPSEEWMKWARTLGKLVLKGEGKGYIQRKDLTFPFHLKRNESEVTIVIEGLAYADRHTLRDFRAVALKSAYCTHCQSCQVECPIGALEIKENDVVISENCSACGSCLKIGGGACLTANSLRPEGGLIMSDSKIEKRNLRDYRSFGLREEWLKEFFIHGNDWHKKSELGPEQIVSMRLWLHHAELITKNTQNFCLTDIASKLIKIGPDNLLTWAVIWTNLVRNSAVLSWYVTMVEWGSIIKKDELIELLGESFVQSKRTRENAINALLNLFERSPLGNLMGLGEILVEKGKKKQIYKKGWSDPIPEAILYSLYRYAEKTERFELTVSELYQEGIDEGPYVLFGIEQEKLKAILRGLATRNDGFIKVDLVKDLDNIFLNRERRSLEVLESV
jgi:phosphoadenosine phosphosulfate reductase